MEGVYGEVSDPEQAWILGELIRYLEHPRSGALDFSDMGEHWTGVRDAVAAGTLRRTDRGVTEVVHRWEQLLQFTALRMGRELGVDVQVQLNRKQQADPGLRVSEQTTELVERGCFNGALRIPGAAGDLELVADLRSGRMHVSVNLDAPNEGRQPTRVNWLLRQLKEAPPQLRLESWSHMSRHSMSELLSTAREAPDKLVEDPKKNLRTFRITATSALGAKRGAGRGGFIDSVVSAVNGFYESVAQDLRPWVPKAPQLPTAGRTAAEAAGIDRTTISDDAPASEGADPSDAELPADDGRADRPVSDERAPTAWAPPTPDNRIEAPLLEWESVSDLGRSPMTTNRRNLRPDRRRVEPHDPTAGAVAQATDGPPCDVVDCVHPAA